METDLESIEKIAIRKSWDAWFEGYGTIKDTNGIWRGRGQEKGLVANYLQTRISEIQKWLAERHLPVRLLILKPRQRGCSTFSSSGLYQEANKRPINGAIIGAKEDQSLNLFKMIGQYSKTDQFDWGTKRVCKAENSVFTHADGQESTIGILSAKEFDPGRSGTYQFLLATEAARWTEKGVANAAEVLSGLLKCVQLVDGTIVILETTAAGASGDFYERWTGGALDFEEYVARYERGENMSGVYVRVFAPWFMFPELSFDLTPTQQDHVHKTLNKVERYNSPDFGNESDMMQQFKLTLGQIAWRRYAIDEECKKDPRVFEQDYPSTWESAFLTSGNRRFNSSGLRIMKKQAEAAECKYGMLEINSRQSNRAIWVPSDEQEGLIYRWEEPREGDRYLIVTDVMTGKDQTKGKDPDCHSAWVLRAGKWINGAGWVPPATVARIKPPCRWEVDLLAEWIKRLHYYYRGAIICPEMNNPGLALITVMKPWNLPIYRREVFDEFEQKFTKQLGWQTTPGNKPMIIANLARAIREMYTEGSGFNVWCPHAVAELSSFIRHPDGKEAAMEGKHDDDVMALAIGLTLIDQAVAYYPLVDTVPLPPDLRDLDYQNGTDNLQYS